MPARPKVVVAAVAVTLALVVTGCSAVGSAPTATTTSPSSHAVKQAAKPIPTPTAVADEVLTGAWETFDRVLISQDIFNDFDGPGALKQDTTSVPVHIPGVGTRTVSLTADVGTGEVRKRTVNVGGPDDSLMLIVETATRLPAHGLNKAGSHNQLDSYDIESGKHIATYEFPDSDSEDLMFDKIAATRGDNVAVDSASSNIAREIVGVNVRTGMKNWDGTSLPDFASRSLSVSSYATFATTSDTSGKPGDASSCYRVDGFDTATGRMLWSVDAATIPDVGSRSGSCSRVRVEALDQGNPRNGSTVGAYFDVILGMSSGLGGDSNQYRTFDGVTGKQLETTVNPLGYLDLLGGYTASQAFTTRSGPLVVTETATGTTVFTVEQDKVDDLGLALVGIFGGWAYTRTTDGTPIIDVATGEVVADNTANMPRQTVGKYTLYTDGTLSLDPHLSVTSTNVKSTGSPSPTTKSGG
jgi:hypothetical protein